MHRRIAHRCASGAIVRRGTQRFDRSGVGCRHPSPDRFPHGKMRRTIERVRVSLHGRSRMLSRFRTRVQSKSCFPPYPPESPWPRNRLTQPTAPRNLDGLQAKSFGDGYVGRPRKSPAAAQDIPYPCPLFSAPTLRRRRRPAHDKCGKRPADPRPRPIKQSIRRCRRMDRRSGQDCMTPAPRKGRRRTG